MRNLLEIDCLKSQFEKEIKNVLKNKFKMLIFDNKELAFGTKKAIILLSNYEYIIAYYKEYTCLSKKYINIDKIYLK